MTSPAVKHLRRICPTLLVASAAAAAAHYRDTLGFTVLHAEGEEFAMIDRDGCRIMFKRGTPAFNRDHVTDPPDFYDLFVHCDSMPAFDALYDELRANAARGLGEITPWVACASSHCATSTGTKFASPAQSDSEGEQLPSVL